MDCSNHDSSRGCGTREARTCKLLDEDAQREITRLCVETGLMLLQHGAESALVESLTRRLGLKSGVDSVQVAIMANAITVTTLSRDFCITTVRRNEDRGINMQVVSEVQHAVLDVEAERLGVGEYGARLLAIRPLRYPTLYTSTAIGVACACFALLAGAEWVGCCLVFVASFAAMQVRLFLAGRHFNPFVTFFVAAFVATSISGLGVAYKLGASPKIAMASSVLLFVPGFPLINSVSDMVKGYINTGLSRGVVGLLLAASTCGGIVLAMTLWNTWVWL